jgi:hypothetical protein
MLSVLPGTAPASAQQGGMSFFITSAGPGKGADLGSVLNKDSRERGYVIQVFP